MRDHCFALVEGTDSRAGMLGLTFVPITERNRQYAPPEIPAPDVDTDRRPVFDMEDETNASGGVVFCGLPAGHALRLSRVGGTGETLGELTAERGTVVVRKFQLRAGRGVPE